MAICTLHVKMSNEKTLETCGLERFHRVKTLLTNAVNACFVDSLILARPLLCEIWEDP